MKLCAGLKWRADTFISNIAFGSWGKRTRTRTHTHTHARPASCTFPSLQLCLALHSRAVSKVTSTPASRPAGGFSTENEASKAYDRAAIVYWGTSAQINVSASLLLARLGIANFYDSTAIMYMMYIKNEAYRSTAIMY